MLRVINTNGYIVCFYYTIEHNVIPRQFIVVKDSFNLIKAKPWMGN